MELIQISNIATIYCMLTLLACLQISADDTLAQADQPAEAPTEQTTAESIENGSIENGSSDDGQDSESDKTRGRLMLAGILGAGLLGWLSVGFAYLRVDHATRGFYSGRLQTIAIGVAVAIAAAIYLACNAMLFN